MSIESYAPRVPAYTLTVLGAAWLSGVLLAAIWPGLAPGLWLAFALGGLLCGGALLLAWPDRRLRWAALALLCFLLGLARCAAALPDPRPQPGSLRSYNVPADRVGRAGVTALSVRGVIAEAPVLVGDQGERYRISVTGVYSAGAWLPVDGALLALTSRYSGVQQGDLVTATGVVADPPAVEGFDYGAYLLRQGVGSYMENARLAVLVPGYATSPITAIASWRASAAELIEHEVPEPAAGLLRGVLLGEQRAIAAGVRDDFTTTGTAHILAISGSNITLLIALVFMLCRSVLGFRGSLIVAALFVGGYSLFVVFGWSVWRAAIMGGLLLLARFIGRPVIWHTLLGATGFTFTLIDPLAITDLGFQLSFAAMLGLVLVTPLVERLLQGKWPLLQALLITLGVELFTGPIISLDYSRLSLISPLANLFVDWTLVPLMALGLVQVALGLIFEPLSQLMAWACWLLLSFLIGTVHLFASLPLAAVDLDTANPLWLPGWYSLLAIAIWWLDRRLPAPRPPSERRERKA